MTYPKGVTQKTVGLLYRRNIQRWISGRHLRFGNSNRFGEIPFG